MMWRLQRNFSALTINLIKKNKLPPRPKFNEQLETECTESFMHGGRGPGGQKINKSNSKVQLKHIPTGIVVECQETRSRDQNRKIAREKMALAIERFRNGIEVNGEVISEREKAVQEWHRQSKKSKYKKSKQKYEEHQELKKQKELEQLKKDEEILKSIFQQN
ncbi:hypothetical protein Kpol_345p5 [Vanderwaltozyma polyspora DSM 70294]|uniref:Prokaryotic-type class I peptide chain release factors domain-containing protein n=1 Tax=Vanderwaltozyma polyspora (strain ATCC 22028 / DSM 70294 / BCRC 21397 / CBS 2163 / NBRC 10782 / NRRL Y-8283 / UCD 57-17) TaxID=436907 RepID=A7TSA0_VANPO|nr:uncharacterized protein Kpol_345p5 [Vanderwaltozyma polyspora DSM 70294]EDO14857.1 hypothetical protein Kpol_345p5 [Vanderwaltozyma polyspora DSM 70294]